jgi:predicted O-methyltransferase YrrM
MTALYNEYILRLDQQSDIAAHLPRLFSTVMQYPKAKVIELGVRFGNSTAALLAGVEAVDGCLWSVDIESPQVPAWWHETGFWKLTIGDDCDPSVVKSLPSCDVLFIDTSHMYYHTSQELHLYVPKVKPAGAILLHDTEYDADHHFPVARALDVFAPRWTNFAGSFGMGVFYQQGQERAA